MSQSPDLRAGDEDRDRTVSLIREAYAEGRLTGDEFQQRMAQAQESRTYGELAALVSDLPVQPPTAPAPLPAPITTPAPASVAVPEEDEHNLRRGWASWVGVSVMVNVIWAASWISDTSQVPYYWPIWVMGPWGAAMVIGTINRQKR